MHERKAKMAELADGFIALPGGLGTLDELCEIVEWFQLGLHEKPIGLLNVSGYFFHLLQFMEHAAYEGFLVNKPKIYVEKQVTALVDALIMTMVRGGDLQSEEQRMLRDEAYVGD